MQKTSCLIIGAGAAGMTAAIGCRRRGAEVLLAERLSKPGKKILASGGGRCNLLNDCLEPGMYNESGRGLVSSVFAEFGLEKLRSFFQSIGVETASEGGRIFPATNQAASVVRAFELELARLCVPVEYNAEAVSIQPHGGAFTVIFSNGVKIESGMVVFAGGGKSYPALGSNGSCLRIARSLGHRIVEPVPSCVALCSRDRLCHHLQGQKITARVSCLINGTAAASAGGDILFTQYGLSGTAVLDVSREVSVALGRQKKREVELSVDLVPFLGKETLAARIKERMERGLAAQDMLTGILPNKFSHALSDLIRSGNPDKIAGALKDRRFQVTGTRGWNEAEFTCGGVDCAQVQPSTLASKLFPGIYFCGEVLDVDGRRGGFNLAWAWASGLAVSAACARDAANPAI